MDNIYTAIIIDDEKPARDSLRTTLNANFPEIEIIGEGSSVKEGISKIESLCPVLVFLDINLFDGSGFNVLEHFQEPNFKVIFITAYNKFALKAFRFNALDYILKPVSLQELTEALEKVKAYRHNWSQEDTMSIKSNWFDEKNENQKIAIRELDGVRYVRVLNIIRCQSYSNYTEVHLASGEKIMTTKILKEYNEILKESGFFRIYQSHLVNLRYIKKIIKKDGLFVQMENGDVLELSRRKRDELFLQMEKMEV